MSQDFIGSKDNPDGFQLGAEQPNLLRYIEQYNIEDMSDFPPEMYRQIQTLDAAVMTAIRHRNQNFIISKLSRNCSQGYV